MSEPRLPLPRAEIEAFCRKWKIARLELFGSVLRDDFGPGSDVDFLYTLRPDAKWGWEFFSADDELAQIIGRPVDLVDRETTERSPNWLRRKYILDGAVSFYEG